MSLSIANGSRRSLFPCGVSFVEVDPSIEADLDASEEAAVERSTERRRQEFRAGRTAAHRALAALGGPDVAIPSGPRRIPQWPAGFVGSISHAPGFCAAAVARSEDFVALGLDVEVRRRVRPHLHGAICGERERAWLASVEDADEAATLLFSAKEATYKCLNPLTGIRLGFHDVEVFADLRRGEFSASVLAEIARCPRLLPGRFAFTPGHVLTAVTIAAGGVA